MQKLQDGLVFFGGNSLELPHNKVLIYLSESGKIILNDYAPEYLKTAFKMLNN